MKKINWRYVFGELFIVIVGITIAFNLNRCSQKSEDKKLKQQYLANLVIDLEQDKKVLQQNIKATKNRSEKIKEIIKIINSGQLLNASHNMLVFEASEMEGYTPANSTYSTLVNSGHLNLIDFELRRAIEKHYTETNTRILSEYERMEIIHKKYLADYYIYHANYDKFSSNEFVFDDTKLLKNILRSMEGAGNFLIKESEEGVKSCDLLVGIINKKK